MNTNFKVIGLTRLGIKLKSIAPEADALITEATELLNVNNLIYKTILLQVMKKFVF